MSSPTTRRAAFLDRDGTVIEDANYLADPDLVRVLPGAVDAVRRLNDAGILTIVVTNQSGIALGLLSEAQYEATRARLDQLLRAGGARIDASYHCPHHPDITGPCQCRKPGSLLHRRAADEHGIDLSASLFVGDRERDIVPGIEHGGFVRLVPSASTPDRDLERARRRALVAPTLGAAIDDWMAAR